jgi:hypothetical protein
VLVIVIFLTAKQLLRKILSSTQALSIYIAHHGFA